MKLRANIGIAIIRAIRETSTKSGILLADITPESAKRYLKGEILDIHPYKYLYKDKLKKVVLDKVETEYKKGDIVLFEEARSRDYLDKKTNEKYYLCSEDMIYCIVEEE